MAKITSEVLNVEYQQICQQLGDAYLKLNQIQSIIKSLETKAAELNNSYSLCQRIEAKSAQSTSQSLTAEQTVKQKADQLRAVSDSLSAL